MRFSELTDEYAENGTYIKIVLTAETNKNLHDYIISLGIANPLGENDFHITLIASLSEIEWANASGIGQTVKPLRIEVWETATKPCLVLVVESTYLSERHQKAVDAGGISQYESFAPHITLSYDCDGGPKAIFGLPHFDIMMDHEHSSITVV